MKIPMNFGNAETFVINRRRGILKVVAVAVAVVGGLALAYTTFGIIQTIGKGQDVGNSLTSEVTSALTMLVGIVAYLLARRNKARLIQLGSYLVIGTFALIIFASLVFTSFSTLTVAALLLPMLGAGLLFNEKELIGWILGLVGLMTLAFILATAGVGSNSTSSGAASDPLFVTNYVFFLILLLIIGGGLWYLQLNIREILGEINNRVEDLHRLSQDREQKRQAGEEVSIRLNSMTAELSAVAVQQTSRSREQAAAVLEVNSSLNEVGETARQISSNTNQVRAAASEGLESVLEVQATSQRATTAAERGQVALNSSIQSIEDVRNGITGLAERLMVLTERSRQIGSIIALIQEIADETHLLALNAAIESAGAGESGRRFAVVATEVKSLADRSLEATKEVSQVITELQGAVAGAVLASEETRKKTFGAVERSYQAGQVINELGQVVEEVSVNSSQIVDAVQQVVALSEEINFATQQQESAIRLIISTMEEVGVVAQENASAINQVSGTAADIDHLSSELKEVLNVSRPLAA